MSKPKSSQDRAREMNRSDVKAGDTEQPHPDGGTEDLMVDGKGGNLPLKSFAPPQYYEKNPKR
jgi:hypothetical protein